MPEWFDELIKSTKQRKVRVSIVIFVWVFSTIISVMYFLFSETFFKIIKYLIAGEPVPSGLKLISYFILFCLAFFVLILYFGFNLVKTMFSPKKLN